MIPPEKYIGVYPFGYGVGKLKIVCKGKFKSWGYSNPQDDYLVETLEFVVESITVGTV